MSLESPALLSTTESRSDMDIILSSSQHSFAPTIIAHASPRSPPVVPTILRPTPSLVNSPFHTPLTEQSPARSPMTPGTPNGDLDSPTCQTPEVDPQILEALRSKDRLYVLKLGEAMESLINERRPRIELSPSTSYQRLLVHRCSAYYRLMPESEPGNKGIAVLLTPEGRIPPRRLCELVPAETSAQPAFKIMRRTVQDRFRNKPTSRAGSVAGEEADFSDVEPSESGSIGGRSNATGSSSNNNKRMTLEEREVAYNQARSRIFMDFDEKEKGKDMNASSSSLSLASGSTSTSSVDDFDDSVGSPATESEWSGSITREKKDTRRGLGSGSSSRSLRSAAAQFTGNSSSSSRGSRASSPSSFTYASLYEPPSSSPYDHSQIPGPISGNGYSTQYMYSYPPPPPPGQALHPSYMAPYPVYVPYAYPPNMLPTADHPPTSAGGMYSPIQHHVGYDPAYTWAHAQPPPAPIAHQHSQPQQPTSSGPPLSQHAPPFQPTYMTPVSYHPYPVPGYYPHPPPQHPTDHHHIRQALPHMPPPPPSPADSRHMNGHVPNSARGVFSNGSGTSSRASSRNSSGSGINGGSKRPMPSSVRTGWYPPGGNGSLNYGGGPIGSSGSSPGGADATVGPRLSPSMRRGSGSSSGNKTSPGDEASSNASSSTTSSSSRRTYTSTASSQQQHPLPPRPDWAVGLKPQPTLHTPHPRHHNSPGAEWSNIKSSSLIQSPRSMMGSQNLPPAKNGEGTLPSHQLDGPPLSPVILQSTDFPPLTSVNTPMEKRAPTVSGAWTNQSSTRSILMPSAGHVNFGGNALVHNQIGVGGPPGRIDEQEHGFERPPPRGPAELFNPNITRRPPYNVAKVSPQQAEKDDTVANAILIGQVMSLTLDGTGAAEAKTETTVIAMST